jgi:hypothetical protein
MFRLTLKIAISRPLTPIGPYYQSWCRLLIKLVLSFQFHFSFVLSILLPSPLLCERVSFIPLFCFQPAVSKTPCTFQVVLFVFIFSFSISRFPEFCETNSSLLQNRQERKPAFRTRNQYVQSNVENTLILITRNIS